MSLPAAWFLAMVGGSTPVASAASTQVVLPTTAAGPTLVASAGIHAAFTLRGASSTRAATHEGWTYFPAAFHAADVWQRVDPSGIEDFVAFEQRPAREELVYDVDVSHVAGLRLTSNTLELLDVSGTPRLRVVAPYVIERGDVRTDARLSLQGCAFDEDPRGPWGRPVTTPGAARCALHVKWHAARYPAVVDPQWTSTASMTQPRFDHAAVLLPSGQVLLASAGSAELFDPITRTFAATGLATMPNVSFTSGTLAGGKAVLLGTMLGLEHRAAVYDAATGLFGAVATAPIETRSGPGVEYSNVLQHAVTLANGTVLAVGRIAARVFDPVAGTFAASVPMSEVRGSATATVLASGMVLVAGGTDDGTANDTWTVFDPHTGTFGCPTAACSMPHRAAHGAVLLPDDTVLLIGGERENAYVWNTTVRVDVAAGTTTAGGSLHESRRDPGVARTPSGHVVVVGGRPSPGGSNTASTEASDVTGNAFTTLPPLQQGVERPTMTVLSDGTVLVAGGSKTTGVGSRNAEILTIHANAHPCTAGADCSSGQCADGVCCDVACDGACEACDVEGHIGMCTAVVGAPHGARPACSGQAPCAGTCDGTLRTACTFAGEEVTCTDTCSSDLRNRVACDGTGFCGLPTNAPCAGHLHCEDSSACKTSCQKDADCIDQFDCAGGSCLAKATCLDADTSKRDDTVEECAPYLCTVAVGTCAKACSTVDDCVAPTTCNSDGACALAATTSDEGCASAANPTPRAGGAWILAGLGLCAVGRRLRRTRRSTR